MLQFHRFTPGFCRSLRVSWWQRCSATSVELTKWRRRCERLVQLQGRIRYPPLKSVRVEDETYQLPLRATDPLTLPSQQELEYLVGFFDGDGCVSIDRANGRMSLKITQSVDSAAVLLYFRDRLGGGVGVQSNRTGRQKACLAWQIYGPKLRHAAALLGQVPSMKQAQLQIARKKIPKTDQAEVVKRLERLKQKEHCPGRLKCTWSYFAGFFDAEGSISVHPLHGGLLLDAKQVNPFVLKSLLSFLHQRGLGSWRLYENEGCWSIRCANTITSKQTLQCLSDAGLRVKKHQAQLALSITPNTHQHIRKAILDLNGWQNRYDRLDEKGVGRAKEIQALQRQSYRGPCTEKDVLRVKIQGLQEEHVFQKLVTKYHLLRKDIRNSLSEGALVTPP